MRLAKKILIFSSLIVALSACGQIDKLKNLQGNNGKGTPTETTDPAPPSAPAPTPSPDPTPDPIQPKQCVLENINAPVDDACLEGSISLADGTLLAGSTTTERTARIVASKKNGGDGGSKFFEHRLRFPSATNIELPEKIPAEGKAGNGQKLYASFGSDVECAWFSKANKEYKDPKCFEGAERAPEKKDGFTGGREVDHDKIHGAEFMQIKVDGASGNGVVTRVQFEASW